jgi:hypothetical protein
MTGKVLITGMLFARPEKRTLRNGLQCVLAIVKSRESNHTRLWHIAAFNQVVQTTLLQLSDGDAVAVQGYLRAELYESSGETRLSCGIIAERALGLHTIGGQRTPKEHAPQRTPDVGCPAAVN